MKQFFKYAFPGFLLLTILISCQKEYETIDVIDDRNVQEYIQQNKLNVQEYQGTGIYYQVVTAGTGPEVQYSDRIPAIITMRSLDGKYVSVDTFNVANRYYNFLGYYNPEGIRVGVKEVLKKSNGTIRMIIPSRLAFGRNGSGSIPGNASMDITVRVLDISKLIDYEDFTIRKYLESNSLTGFTRTTTGLYYKIGQPGTGSPITVDSTIVANYTGKLLNGAIFDRALAGSEATFTLNSLVQGWRQAVPLIKQGGSIRLIVPSSLGYGLDGSSPSIPAFSALDFDITVTDVKQ
ncbi:FKBP-type peptidyl-prolyl cis-trans isomerase [Daejeonella rubra]|uniref:Peptidyl-prolyl cis-trans isomerase n=1 Tax=Daejeonella rubra TaxID=990371 RepID=A0A1G9VRM7_9SPHI|nr:FKBP-type peptidyl-prolyl cis-trans isomerase [Daejeonella rubra]SDM74763.1 FKBP-type peptidyl-prolyl cis-trans isomerase [Daejeonella rubra]